MPVINTRKILALLVDLDGVVTQTAKLHARSWKATFDDFLQGLARRAGEVQRPFDIENDYRAYVDGEPRYDGVRSFLKSRHISLREGTAGDAPGFDTVHALGNLKNERYHALLRDEGAEVFKGAVALLHKAKAHGLKLAVISSSRNCAEVLASVHLTDVFDTRVDGIRD